MRHILRAIGILFLINFMFPAQAQEMHGNVNVKSWSIKDIGLSTRPTRLLVDKKGILWIGSNNGLASFDGNHFTMYTDKDGLTGNFVTDIELAPDGTVYVATQKGISRFTNEGTHPFERLSDFDDIFFISCILPLNKDTVLLGDLAFQGLHRWVRGKLDAPYPNIGILENVFDIQKDNNGHIYITQPTQLLIYNGQKYDSISITQNQMTWPTLEKDIHQDVWCGAGLLYRLGHNAGRAGITDSIPMPPPAPAVLNRISSLPDGRLLAGNSSLWVYNNGHWDTLLTKSYLKAPIAFITTNGRNTTWLCGAFGLIKLTIAQGQVQSSASAMYTYTTLSGRQFAGTHTLNAKEFKTWNGLSGVMRQVYVDRSSRTWYLTTDGLYKQANGKLQQYKPEMIGVDQAVIFNAVLEDNTNRLWFGTETGLIYFEKDQFVQPTYKIKGTPDRVVHAATYLAMGRFGQILIGNLTALQTLKGDFYKIEKDFGGPKGKGSINLSALVRNNRDEIWACMSNTIYRVDDWRDGSLKRADSLTINYGGNKEITVENIAFDSEDNLWVLGRNLLQVYLRQGGPVKYSSDKLLFFTANDYPGPLNTDGAGRVYSDSQGRIIITRNNMIYIMDAPNIISAALKEQPPLLSFTALLLNGHLFDWQQAGYKISAGIPIAPSFHDSTRQLTFQFVATTDKNPEYITYEYQISGYDNEWNSNGLSGNISFSHLPPGNYTLKVRALDINNRPGNIVSCSFSVLPPWWRTWWAIILWCILFLCIIFLLFQWRLHIVKRKARIEQLLVEEKLKSLRAQINPHFLHNTFNFLSSMLDEQPVAQSQKVIRELSSYLRNVLHRSDETISTLEDELDFAKEYLNINFIMLSQRFTYSIEIGEDVDIFGIKLPSLFLQPLLENAIKHGVFKSKETAAIRIHVYSQHDYVYCVIGNSIVNNMVRDKAPGYQPKGLSITTERLALLYRNFSVKPTITVTITDNQYIVTIKLPY